MPNQKEALKSAQAVWNKLQIVSMNLDVNLVRLQQYLFPKGRGKKLLYIGFGEGQNLVYLAKQGFDVYGTELAETRIKETKKRLKKENLKAHLYLVSSNQLPFNNDFFDVVVAWQSLFYNNGETLKNALKEIRRVLKPGGQFLSSVISTKQELLCHKKIGHSLYRPAKETGQGDCVIFCFKNKKEIRWLWRDFSKVKIGFYSSYLFKNRNFHYVVYCLKPEK